MTRVDVNEPENSFYFNYEILIRLYFFFNYSISFLIKEFFF